MCARVSLELVSLLAYPTTCRPLANPPFTPCTCAGINPPKADNLLFAGKDRNGLYPLQAAHHQRPTRRPPYASRYRCGRSSFHGTCVRLLDSRSPRVVPGRMERTCVRACAHVSWCAHACALRHACKCNCVPFAVLSCLQVSYSRVRVFVRAWVCVRRCIQCAALELGHRPGV